MLYMQQNCNNDYRRIQRTIKSQRSEYGNKKTPPSSHSINRGFTDFSLFCTILYMMQCIMTKLTRALTSAKIHFITFFAIVTHLPFVFAIDWETIQKLSSDSALTDDAFGVSVSVYDKYAVIGAYKDDDAAYTAYDSGSAYIFEQTNVWTQTAKLEPNDASTGDYFGFSVAIYDKYAVIGSYFDDDMGSASGSAYIFERNDQTNDWSQTAKLLANDGASNDYFGFSVSIYDQYVVIGAYGADHINGTNYGYYAGRVYIYEIVNDIWIQTTTLFTKIAPSISEEQFGFSVSIYGKYIAIGANEDTVKGTDSGSVYIFERDDQTAAWSQTAKLVANDGSSGDRFGSSVSIYDKYVVIGAKNANPNGLDSGSAYIFKKDDQSDIWTQTAKLTASDGASRDYFGTSVAIYDETVVIGADSDDDMGTGSGSVYIYERNDQTDIWTQTAKLTASDGASSDYFGCSVAIYTGNILIGADGTDTGSVYIVQNPSIMSAASKAPTTKDPTKAPMSSNQDPTTKDPTKAPMRSNQDLTEIPTKVPTKGPIEGAMGSSDKAQCTFNTLSLYIDILFAVCVYFAMV